MAGSDSSLGGLKTAKTCADEFGKLNNILHVLSNIFYLEGCGCEGGVSVRVGSLDGRNYSLNKGGFITVLFSYKLLYTLKVVTVKVEYQLVVLVHLMGEIPILIKGVSLQYLII